MKLLKLAAAAILLAEFIASTAQAALLPAATCSGPIGPGYGTITIQPDREDGKVHGIGKYEEQGKPPFSAEFIGEPKPGGTIELRHLDGTLWFDGVRMTGGVFTGRYHNQFTNIALDARFPCH